MKNPILKVVLKVIFPPFYGLLLLWYKCKNPHFKKDFNCKPVFMIRQLPGKAENWKGTKRRKANLGNTHPWNRYFNRSLSTQVHTLKDIEIFLRKCKYISDQRSRSQRDYWEPPDIFEKRCKGDCEDHAIWAWRQLYELGYDTRLVLGKVRKGHAWVHIFINERCYLLETTIKKSILCYLSRYKPFWSVEHGDGKKYHYYLHSEDT